jgi:hypothetical protein
MALMWGWHALVWIGQRCRQRWRWWWYRRRIAQLQDHVQRALQAGAIEEAVGMLELQQGLYDWPFQVEALLFKRSRRPDSLSLTLALLERLQAAPGLRPHQRVYAGIALAYAALQADDTLRLQELRPWLESVASLGRVDEPRWSERGVRNRESLFKQRVSARSCLLQCALASSPPDRTCIAAIGEASLRTLKQLESGDLEQDVLYRSSSNLVRGVLALPFTSPWMAEAELQLEQLLAWVAHPSFRPVRLRAKEDHVQVIRDGLEVLRHGRDQGSASVQTLRLHLLVNSEAPAVRQGAELWLQQIVER